MRARLEKPSYFTQTSNAGPLNSTPNSAQWASMVLMFITAVITKVRIRGSRLKTHYHFQFLLVRPLQTLISNNYQNPKYYEGKENELPISFLNSALLSKWHFKMRKCSWNYSCWSQQPWRTWSRGRCIFCLDISHSFPLASVCFLVA